jgi:transposase
MKRMSIQPQKSYPIPEETQRVAHAAFPKGNVYMRMRDELGEVYQDRAFQALFPGKGQPAESPGRLAWVTVLQFSEGLSDRQAADAVRARIDWKYVLGLELTDEGFDYSVLSEFRGRLIAGRKEAMLLDQLLQALQKRGLLKAGGKQRTDATHILAAIRQLNRMEIVGETMRQALNALAEAAPAWLKSVAPEEWYPRYGRRFEKMRLPKHPTEREALSLQIGRDGLALLAALSQTPESAGLEQLEEIVFLRRMWLQQYWEETMPDGSVQLHVRADDNQPPGELRLHSPHDADARYSAKGDMSWVGYKSHLTETCDAAPVHAITQVHTTLAPLPDTGVPAEVHVALANKDLSPAEHFLDAGYVDADTLVSAKHDFGIAICGPVHEEAGWQAKPDTGFALAHFRIDWEHQSVTCPAGQTSRQWCQRLSPTGKAAIQVRFSPTVCRACPSREQCTRAQRGARTLTFLPQAQYNALQQAREQQHTPAFQSHYALRSGIEGTISQAVRRFDLRHSRYIGLAKTHLQMLATAAAINLHRLFDWWEHKPRAKTRISPFAQLAPKWPFSSPWWAPT